MCILGCKDKDKFQFFFCKKLKGLKWTLYNLRSYCQNVLSKERYFLVDHNKYLTKKKFKVLKKKKELKQFKLFYTL